MKKKIIAVGLIILIAIVMTIMLLMNNNQEHGPTMGEEYMAHIDVEFWKNNNGITMELTEGSIQQGWINYKITNNTEYTIEYGGHFYLYIKQDYEWRRVKKQYEEDFALEAITLKRGEHHQRTIVLSAFGPLPEGEYIIVREFIKGENFAHSEVIKGVMSIN